MITKLLLIFIRLYQKFISPILPARCRYYPTCSAYAHTALKTHSLSSALILITKRLLSCQPFGGSGIDFVPIPLYRYHFISAKVCYYYGSTDYYSYKCLKKHWLKSN